MKSYTKIQLENCVYWIQTGKTVVIDAGHQNLLTLADYAVNVKTKEIIKNRSCSGDIISLIEYIISLESREQTPTYRDIFNDARARIGNDPLVYFCNGYE